jgi:hypothetical protein
LRIRIDHPDLHKAVSFVRTSDSIDPVSLVHSICKDAKAKPDQKKSRFIKRMTPMTLMGKIMSGGLEHVCQSVLRPHFHAGGPTKKVSEERLLHRVVPHDLVKSLAASFDYPPVDVLLVNFLQARVFTWADAGIS